ncbi:MAG: DUF523 and DUF1722 domain-containing protein [Candidatus Latescibacteria bacterium]|nr:DUF523 and DUF1722 domain-containing protein [Candidatus Latescibacterota bacterium]
MSGKIKLGISTCLLGEQVRYDGGHKLDRFLRDTLGQYVDYIPVCPEVECGLSIPREAMRLVGNPENPRLVTIRTKIDYTDLMQSWGVKRLKELEKEDLCGYIFKSKSPSSGLERVKVYYKNGMPVHNGIGIWARMFLSHFPYLPVEDEGRLHDPGIRENFIERIFILKRWREMIVRGKTMNNLIDFHTDHKLLIMAHSPQLYRAMGKIVAEGKNHNIEELFHDYREHMIKAMQLKTTTKKNVNVLQHIMGYFKKNLSADEKQELMEIIESYHHEFIPLIVPVTLLNHYVRKYGQQYLKRQFYLNPHPLELKLRTHV